MADSRQIIGTFPIGDEGDAMFVVAEWNPDPDVLQAELLQLDANWSDWRAPLMLARTEMIESTRLHFETESDPYGDKWEQLTEDYWHSKVELGGFPDSILVRTGALEQAATGQEAWFVDERSIYFNAGALPLAPDGANYGMIHQEGTEGGTKASSFGKLQSQLDAIAKQGKRARLGPKAAEVLSKGERGLSLPQRMFVGADTDTIAAIEEIFIRHWNGQVDKFYEEGNIGGIINEEPTHAMSGGEMFPIMRFTSRGQPIVRTPKGPRFGKLIP